MAPAAEDADGALGERIATPSHSGFLREKVFRKIGAAIFRQRKTRPRTVAHALEKIATAIFSNTAFPRRRPSSPEPFSAKLATPHPLDGKRHYCNRHQGGRRLQLQPWPW